jgi:hypothetical protein
MRTLKLMLPAAIALLGLLATTTATYGKPEYMKKEKGSKCVTCHTKMGAKDLNETGKYYKEKKELPK